MSSNQESFQVVNFFYDDHLATKVIDPRPPLKIDHHNAESRVVRRFTRSVKSGRGQGGTPRPLTQPKCHEMLYNQLCAFEID